MANLSQEKREKMLNFLNKIRAEHQDDETRLAINEIENALTEKKYGLVWEEHTERVDEEIVHNIPIFTEDEDKKIKTIDNNEYNFIIEGDNLHSLKLLEKTHEITSSFLFKKNFQIYFLFFKSLLLNRL